MQYVDIQCRTCPTKGKFKTTQEARKRFGWAHILRNTFGWYGCCPSCLEKEKANAAR